MVEYILHDSFGPVNKAQPCGALPILLDVRCSPLRSLWQTDLLTDYFRAGSDLRT